MMYAKLAAVAKATLVIIYLAVRAMELPDYKRAFDQPDFRGYFRWTRKLSRALGGSLYHACHEDELKEILDNGELDLRSEWSLKLPKHGQWSPPGVWVGLNYFHKGNYYGPILLEFPITVLDGRHFMVFQRKGDRQRTFFVQYEARIPIYSFGKELWRKVNPQHYFDMVDKKASKKPGAIYDIVLTQPLSLDEYTARAVDHPMCISEKCGGTSLAKNEKTLLQVAKREAQYLLSESGEVRNLLNRFPCLEDKIVTLKSPEE